MEEEATRYPKNNMPRIVKIGSQYFIIAEQDVLTEIDNITDAIYLWFITHFIFNIKYDKSLMNVGLFFQDNILQHTDNSSRSAKYNSVVGDLKQLIRNG